MEGFDFAFNPGIDQSQITDLADGRFIVSGQSRPVLIDERQV